MSIGDKFLALKINGKFFRGFEGKGLDFDLVDHPMHAMQFFSTEELGRYMGELEPKRREALLGIKAMVSEIKRTPKPEGT